MLQVAAMLPQSASIAVQYMDIKILNFNTLYIYTYTLQLFKHKPQNLSIRAILCINLQLLC